MDATGWQPHTCRGVIPGTLKKRLRLGIESTRDGDVTRCQIVQTAGDQAGTGNVNWVTIEPGNDHHVDVRTAPAA